MTRLILGSVCPVCLFHPVYGDMVDLPASPSKTTDASPGTLVPWSDLNDRSVGLAKSLLAKPTVHARGPVDTFACTPAQYCWLLDNPDRAVTAWRRLGAKCVSIQRRGPATFGYTDPAGSDISWEVIHQAPGVRIWFAEGKVKASAVLPLVPVKGLVVLRYSEARTPGGTTVVKHYGEVVIQTESKAANAVTKLMGQSAPKLAEQGMGHLQIFFSAPSHYVDRHPDQVETLFRPEK